MIFIQGILSSCFVCIHKKMNFGHLSILLDLFVFCFGFLLDAKSKRKCRKEGRWKVCFVLVFLLVIITMSNNMHLSKFFN